MVVVAAVDGGPVAADGDGLAGGTTATGLSCGDDGDDGSMIG